VGMEREWQIGGHTASDRKTLGVGEEEKREGQVMEEGGQLEGGEEGMRGE